MNWRRDGGFSLFVLSFALDRSVLWLTLLKSADLTRIPVAQPSTLTTATSKLSKPSTTEGRSASGFEYSSREVAPPSLLIQQLLQAHRVFSLHHGPSLNDLYAKLPRDRFFTALDRFWSRFARTWDVLLHGNPTADVLGGIKLASGGELGFGVGEEEWGSGERAVLEQMAHQTEGLVDLVVARYGEPSPTQKVDQSTAEAFPWLGSGHQPAASDGVVFGGVNGISRSSLRSVSLWMREIYTYGDHAYGVRDNPTRDQRKRRRRNPPASARSANANIHAAPEPNTANSKDLRRNVQNQEAAKQLNSKDPVDPDILPLDGRPQLHDRIASHDHVTDTPLPQVASYPGIPPVIVTAAEAALDKATKHAEVSGMEGDDKDQLENEELGTTMGIPDQYMKYLTFGLSTFGKAPTKKRPSAPSRTSTSSSKTLTPHSGADSSRISKRNDTKSDEFDASTLTVLEPHPDGDALRAVHARQKRQENKGHFLIGLRGDLDLISEEEGEADMTEGSLYDATEGHRTVLRTVHVETLPNDTNDGDHEHLNTDPRDFGQSSESAHTVDVARLRVVIYTHRPFMYCFLFHPHTSSLSWSSFYRSLHKTLLPIHRPLLSSTSKINVTDRIEAAHVHHVDSTVSTGNTRTSQNHSAASIYDLLYDPVRLTVHTSIPNIPEPGTPAAESIATSMSGAALVPWTRLDALNVHSTILNTLAITKQHADQIERTSKTGRGWWVVWMRLPTTGRTGGASLQPSGSGTEESSTRTVLEGDENLDHNNHETHKFAFLVRRADDASAATKHSSGSRATSGMWNTLTLRSTPADNHGAARGGNGLNTGGIGFDARKYVEGLLSLNR